jgi:hypothetical protein
MKLDGLPLRAGTQNGYEELILRKGFWTYERGRRAQATCYQMLTIVYIEMETLRK